MALSTILTLLIFLFPLAFSPGPGNMFFAANGAKFGFVNTLSANIGYHLATVVVTFLIGLGFNFLILFIKNNYQYIQILGSIYVIYLSYKFFKLGKNTESNPNLKCTFVDGIILMILNPKTYMIIVLMFSIFLDNNQNISKIIFISLIFTLNNFFSFSLWTLFGDFIGTKFRNERYSKLFNNIFSLMLFLVGIWMLTMKNNF